MRLKKQKTQEIVESIKKDFQSNNDIIIRQIKKQNQNIFLVFIDEIVNQEEINLNIITPLHNYKSKKKLNLEDIKNKAVSLCNTEILQKKDFKAKLLQGFALLFIDSDDRAIGFNVLSFQSRSIEEPPSSTVISGEVADTPAAIKFTLSDSVIAFLCPSTVKSSVKVPDLIINNGFKLLFAS